MKSGLVAAILLSSLIAFAVPAHPGNLIPGCCACLTDDEQGCPVDGFVCFNNLDNCVERCSALGCPKVAGTLDAVCGEGGFQICQVIDPGTLAAARPAPMLSPVALTTVCLALLGLQIWRRRRGSAEATGSSQ